MLMLARTLAASLLVLLAASTAAHGEDPWADAVVTFVQGPNVPTGPYSDPSAALGRPAGGATAAPSNESLVSLGSRDGVLVLRFDTPVTDDPGNPLGLDCIVYGNAFWVGGNNQRKFQEVAVIEISRDANGNGQADDTWYLIPGSRGFSYPLNTITEDAGQTNSADEPYFLMGNITNPSFLDGDAGNDTAEYNWGYGDMNPTLVPYLDNHVRPGDPFTVGHEPGTGGGDAFDIAWAVDDTGAPANITEFDFIRIRALIERQAGPLGYFSPEVDAVADVAPDVDTDGDGILDEFEVRVSGTDPDRPESTVLPLEIPADEGGSPAGALLGTARDAAGNRIRLYSEGERDYGLARSVEVDIETHVPGQADLPSGGLLLSGAARTFSVTETDFVTAQVEDGEFTIAYASNEIAGLDEEQLQPLRLDGTAYTDTGISSVQVLGSANQVTFRSRYAGTFALASVAGAGDPDSTTGPQGTIVLTAAPADETVANPVNSVAVESEVVLDDQAQPVADGTLFTVAASLGDLVTADADAGLDGHQVASSGGRVAFEITAPSQSGSSTIQVSSVTGAAYGELAYRFVPGPAEGPIAWQPEEPTDEEPLTTVMGVTAITDQFGNRVADGTLLTVTVTGATIVSGDADLALAGHQVRVAGGQAELYVEVPVLDADFIVETYRDAGRTILLDVQTFNLSEFDFAQVPVSNAWLLAALALGMAVLGGYVARRHAA